MGVFCVQCTQAQFSHTGLFGPKLLQLHNLYGLL